MLPKIVLFEVVGISHSRDVSRDGGNTYVASRLSLVLRADSGTRIELIAGEALEDVDVHLTVVDAAVEPEDDEDVIGTDGVGFLCHTEDKEMPVHGGVWLPGDLAQYVGISSTAKLLVQLHLKPPDTAVYEAGDWSLQWKLFRENSLQVRSFQISCVQRDA